MSTRCDEFECNNPINTPRVQNPGGLPLAIHDYSNNLEVRIVVTSYKELCTYCEDKYIMQSLAQLQIAIDRVLHANDEHIQEECKS